MPRAHPLLIALQSSGSSMSDWTIELILLTNERMKHSYYNINSNVSNPLALRKHYGPTSNRQPDIFTPYGLFSSFFVPLIENKVSLTRKLKWNKDRPLMYCLLKAVLTNTQGSYKYHKLAHPYSSSLHFWSLCGWVALPPLATKQSSFWADS